MFGGKDMRRRDKFQKKHKHFKNKKHAPRTEKDSNDREERDAPSDRRPKRSRRENKKLAQETLDILETGQIFIDNDIVVDIKADLRSSRRNTITYTPVTSLQLANQKLEPSFKEAQFEVRLESTLDACMRLSKNEDEGSIAALNFASAKNPGGGFLKGSMAQEESLALSSGLYFCIRDSPMYEANKNNPLDGLYQHFMMFSQDVPIFRNSEGNCIEPFFTSFLTVPAVNFGAARRNRDELEMIRVMSERMDRMFAMAAHHDIDCLILGSWGCGVFGGDINVLAETFKMYLDGKYKNVFSKIVFATLDKKHSSIFESHFGVETRRLEYWG